MHLPPVTVRVVRELQFRPRLDRGRQDLELVAFDCLEKGLHHEVIRACEGEQEGGQRILATAPVPPPPGGYVPGVPMPGHDDYPGKMDMMIRRHAQMLPMTIFTINLQTGEVKKLYQTNDWINHFQFSPKDPTLMSFAHEGID